MVGTKEHPQIFVPLSTRRQLDPTLIPLALNCHHRSMLLTLDTWWTARPLMRLATTQCTELIEILKPKNENLDFKKSLRQVEDVEEATSLLHWQ